MSITNFEKIISVLNIQKRESLEQEIKTRYTPRLFSGEELVERSSLEGYIIDFIREWTSLDSESKKWKHIFRNAFSSLSNDYADKLGLSIDQRIELFELEFQYKKRLISEQNYTFHSEIFDEPVPVHWTKDPAYLTKRSLFRDWDKDQSYDINSQIFENLFQINQNENLYREDHSSLFTHAITHLKKIFPVEAEEISALLDGAGYNADQLNQCIAKGFESTEDERNANLRGLSEKIFLLLQTLQVGEKKLIFCPVKESSPDINFSHLSQDNAYAKIFKNFINFDKKSSEIVDSLLNEIGKIVYSFQKSGDLQQISGQVQDVLEKGMTHLIFSKINESYFNDNQSYSEKAQYALPELVRLSLKDFLVDLEKDAVDKVAEYVPSTFTKELCLELCKATKDGNLDEVLQRQLKSFLTKHLKTITHQLRGHFFSITDLLPSVASEMFTYLGLGSLGSSKSNLWLEFEPLNNGHFNLLVYTSGKGVTVQGIVPLIYKDLSAHQLNVNFFLRLFSFIALNEWEEDSFDLQDIHRGLFSPLAVEPSVPEKVTQSISDDVHEIPTVWGVLKAFISRKLPFAEKKDRDLFFFVWKRKVLIDYCMSVQENPSFRNNLKEYASIPIAAKALSKEALELFNHKQIDFEELHKIYATTWEILEVFEEKPAKRNEKVKPHILPLPIVEGIHTLFKHNYKNAALLRNVIIDVLGDGVKAGLDAILEDLAIPIETLEEVVPETEANFYDSDRKWVNIFMDAALGFDLDDLENPNSLSYIKFALSIGRFALSIIFPEAALLLLGGWAIFSIAKAALIHYVKDVYPEEYQILSQKTNELSDYLDELRLKIIVKAASYLFLDEDQRENLSSLVQTWQAYLTHQGKLSFEVDALPEPKKSTFDIKKVSFTVQPSSEDDRKSYSAHTNSRSIKIDEHNCFDFLNKYIDEKSCDEEVIGLLPSPLDACWERITYQDYVLEFMAYVAEEFYLRHIENNRDKDKAVIAIVCLFKCYAIMDKLARRCPDGELEGYSSNPFALVFLKENAFFQIKDSYFLNQFIDTCTYFKIDYDKDYTDDEFSFMTYESVFKLNRAGFRVYDLSFPAEYYEAILNKKETQDKFKALNITDDTAHIDKLALIYADGKVDPTEKSSNRFLPRPFHLLRMVNLWANELTDAILRGRSAEKIEGIEEFPAVYQEGDHGFRKALQKISFDQWFHKEDTLLPYKSLPGYKASVQSKGCVDAAQRHPLASIGWIDKLGILHASKYVSDGQGTNWGWESPKWNFHKVTSYYFHSSRRKQNDILNNPCQFFKIKSEYFDDECPNVLSNLPENERKIIEMIWAEESDQAVRTIAYFSQRIDRLEDPAFRALFDLLIFRRNVLERQFNDEPHFIKTLGAFFHKAIDYYTNKKRHDVLMPLIEIGQFCLAKARFKNNLAFMEFPRFPKIILAWAQSDYLKNPDLFPSYYKNIRPKDIGLEERKELCICLCQYFFIKDADKDNQAFKRGWDSELTDLLNECQDTRNAALNAIAKSKKLTVKDLIWTGQYPNFRSGEFELNMYRYSYGARNTDKPEIRKCIEEQTFKIFGYSISPFFIHGQYRSPFFSVTIKKVDGGSSKLIFSKYIDSVGCRLIELDLQDERPHITYWLEEEEKSIRQLFVLEKGEVVQKKRVLQGEEKGKFQDVEVDYCEPQRFVNLKKDRHHLHLLSWFQPLEKILVYRDYEGITQIYFKDLELFFVMAIHKGKKIAEGIEGLSGFYISEEQRSSKISALNFHSRYLLLENDQKQHKVILLSETLCAIASLWFVNQLIPFSSSHLLDQHLDKTLKPFFLQMTRDKELPKYYVYTLDEQGKLYSEDSMALFHLLIHALAHDDTESFMHYLILIERIGRRLPFSKELFQYVTFIHVAALCSQEELLLRASLRLAAIVEENALIQIDSESSNIIDLNESTKESTLEWIVLQINYFRYLKNPDQTAHLPIDEYQELFILHGITKRAKEISKGIQYSSKHKDLIEKIDPDYIVDTLLMPPQISQRYAFLKAKYENYEKENSVLNSIYDGVKERVFNRLLSAVQGGGDREPGMQETFIQNVLRGGSLRVLERRLLGVQLCHFHRNNLLFSYIESYEKDWQDQNLLKIYSDLLKTVWKHIPINFLELIPGNLNEYFLYYYQLATGEPSCQLEDQQLEMFKQRSEVFKQSLKAVQGKKFQRDSLLLILQLASQASRWISFPSLQEVEKKLMRLINLSKETPKKSSYLQQNPIGEFDKYLLEFNKQILGMCYASLVAPTLKKGIQSIGKLLSGQGGLIEGSDNEQEKRLEIASSERKLTLERNQKKEAPLPEILLKRIEEEDRRLGAFPKKLLQDHFKPLKITQKGNNDKGKEELIENVSENPINWPKDKTPIKPFICPSKDPFIQKEFDCFNHELIEGYNRPGDQEYPHEPLGIRDYFEMKHALAKEIKRRGALLKQLRESLLKERVVEHSDEEHLIHQAQEQNKLPQKSVTLEKQSKFNGLMKAFINNEEPCKDRVALFYLYLVISTRTQQLVRAMNLMNKIDPKQLLDDETKVLFKEFGFELGRDRAYPLKGTLPTKLLRTYLAFEEGTGFMLWEKLVKPLQKMILDEHSNIISQMPTGVGKTTCEKPLGNFFSSGSKVMANIFPEALAAENIRYLSGCSHKVFGKLLNGFSSTRRRMTVDQLWAFEMMLKRSLDHRESLNACKQDFQTLRQLFIEEIYQANMNPNKVDKSLIWAYMKVCRFIREHVKGNFDEVDSVVHYSKVLNHPFGKPQGVKKEYVIVIFATVRLLFTIPELEKKVSIATNDQTLCTSKQYKEVIKPLLAKGMCAYKPFNIQPAQEELFIHYLCGKSKKIPDFVLRHPRKQEIFLCRGLINDILPRSLNQRINVDFGIEGNPHGYAQIYSGKDTPVIGAILKNPIEAIVKTIICWRFIPLTSTRTQSLIEKMVERAGAEAKEKGINFEETESSCLFQEWTKQNYQLKAFENSPVDSDVEDKITEFFNQSYAARMSYAFIPIEQIHFYPINMFCSSYNGTSMFSSYNGSTATPNIPELSPNHTKIFMDPGAIGDAIHFIDSACAEEGRITVLKHRVPKKAYKELLHTNFRWKSRHIAVIDGSAIFNGLKNEEASLMALNFIKLYRPNLEALVYYQGNDCVIQGVDKASVPFRNWNLPPNKRITYYDATHTTGADFKQPIGGIGSVSISETETIGNLVQAAGRMRGTKTLQQSIALFTNEAVKEIMTSNKNLKSRDILAHLQMNQARKNKEGVFVSVQQRVDDYLSSVVYDAMIFANNVDDAMKFAVHLHFFLEKANYEDMTAYGVPKSYEDGRIAFKQYCDEKFEPIKNSRVFTETQKQKIYFGLLDIGVNFTFPRVKLPVQQGKINFHRYDIGFSQQLSIDVSQNQDTHLNVQQQQNQNIHQNQDLFVSGKESTGKKIPLRSQPAKWNRDLDYFSSLDWLCGEEKKSSHTSLEVYRISQSLSISVGVFSSVAKAFGGNLVWTNNARGIQVDSKLAPVCAEKPIFEALVIERPNPPNEKSRYIICMIDHQEDVEFWRWLLSTEKRGPLKIALYDLWLGSVIMRGKDQIDLNQLESSVYFQFDISRAKYLAGNPNFTKKESVEKMEKWITKYGMNEMKQAFGEVYRANGITPLRHSQISRIFSTDEKDALPDLLT